MNKLIYLFIAILIVSFLCFLNLDFKSNITTKNSTKVEESIDERVDKILLSMSKTEKLGQMIMIGIYGTDVTDDSIYMLHQYHIGGIVLFDRNLKSTEQIKNLIKNLQRRSEEKVPLFIAIDEEGGEVVRMKEIIQAPPSQLEIAKTNKPENARMWAKKTASELKKLGINTNFAPVADLGSMGMERHYSNNVMTVKKFVMQAAKGYEDENMLYSLKHFPGIGKAVQDPHIDSVTVMSNKKDIMNEDILPFEYIIKENIPENYFIMVSNVVYPFIAGNIPSSLSSEIMTNILRKELGYHGIIITDDMDMGSVSKYYNFRDIGVKSIEAGADIVMICHDYSHATDAYLGLLDALDKGEISEKRIDESVRRIIKVKLLHLM